MEEFVKKIILIQTKLKEACEGFDPEKNKQVVLSNRLKLLLILDDLGKISPSTLVPYLSMAKSNLNLMCNKMLNDNVIIKIEDDFDRRVIYYKITENGKKELNENLSVVKKNVEKKFKDLNNELITKKIDELNKLLEQI